MSMSSARRSARLRRNNSTRGAQEQWGNLSGIWWNQYVDFTQHARRLPRCTQRLIDASCEDIDALRSMEISFVALAITTVAARSTSRLGVPSTTENELIVYIQTAALKDLAVNEVYNGYSSVELAAYHGLTNVLTALLTMGCPLKKSSLQANAIFASVRNGKHDSLEIILNTNKEGSARRVIRQEADVIKSTGKFLSTFMQTMTKCDVKSALLLLDHDCLEMSDKESKYIFNGNKKFLWDDVIGSGLDLFVQIPMHLCALGIEKTLIKNTKSFLNKGFLLKSGKDQMVTEVQEVHSRIIRAAIEWLNPQPFTSNDDLTTSTYFPRGWSEEYNWRLRSSRGGET